MTRVITSACIGTKSNDCVDVCPVDCIHPAKGRDYHGGPPNQGTKNYDEVEHLYINPDECIDCGACEPVCPVSATFPEDDVPQDQRQFVQINADYYKKSAEPATATP